MVTFKIRWWVGTVQISYYFRETSSAIFDYSFHRSHRQSSIPHQIKWACSLNQIVFTAVTAINIFIDCKSSKASAFMTLNCHYSLWLFHFHSCQSWYHLSSASTSWSGLMCSSQQSPDITAMTAAWVCPTSTLTMRSSPCWCCLAWPLPDQPSLWVMWKTYRTQFWNVLSGTFTRDSHRGRAKSHSHQMVLF